MAIDRRAPEKPPLIAVRGKPLRLPWTRSVWATVAACLTVTALTGQFLIVPRTAPALRAFTTSGWAYPQDSEHEVDTQVANKRQTAVPVRFGQRQGFEIDIYNPSNKPQKVLGLVAPAFGPGGAGDEIDLEVGTTGTSYYAGDPTTVGFAPQVTIPPHQVRWLKVTWISTRCLAPGTTVAFETLRLSVRVGPITRVETVHLPMEFAITVPRDATATNADCLS